MKTMYSLVCWIQGEFRGILMSLLTLFNQSGMMANISKSKTMTCQLGAIPSEISEEAFGWKSTVKGATYQEQLRRRLLCPYCGVELTFVSMTTHRRHLHGNNPDIKCNQLPFIHMEHPPPQVYDVRFLRDTTKFQCPFPGFPGLSCTRSSLHNHSTYCTGGKVY